jgi:hypothetical protein
MNVELEKLLREKFFTPDQKNPKEEFFIIYASHYIFKHCIGGARENHRRLDDFEITAFINANKTLSSMFTAHKSICGVDYKDKCDKLFLILMAGRLKNKTVLTKVPKDIIILIVVYVYPFTELVH